MVIERKKSANGRYVSTPQEVFERNVRRGDGCWLWTSYTNSKGYGFTRLAPEYRGTLAHRLAWEVTYGEIPDGMHVLHKCDNPPCVRPDHLFLGTNADNIADRVSKGRLGGAKPKVTADMTKQMLRMHHSGKTQRDIARSMGLSEGYVSGFLRGRFKHNKDMTI